MGGETEVTELNHIDFGSGNISLNIGDKCMETSPCQHLVTVRDGRKYYKDVLRGDIIAKLLFSYAPRDPMMKHFYEYLPGSLKVELELE